MLPNAQIGSDCNICSHVFIENNVIIGNRVTIKCGVQIWDGLHISDDVFIGPNVSFTNDRYPRSTIHPVAFTRTTIHQGASIGANATILPGVSIGHGAIIGAGAIVTRDVPAHAVVIGAPARISRYIQDKPDLATNSDDNSAISVERYTPGKMAEWDLFLSSSKNSTFLFNRSYMNYHSDRFDDYSLMVYVNNKLAGILPANKSEQSSVTSHDGLTYGGLVLPRSSTLGNFLSVFHAALRYLHSSGIETLIYKSIPSFYNTLPDSEADYAMFLLGATLFRRDCAIVIDQQDRLPLRKGRKSEISKAKRFGVILAQETSFEPFWNQILIPRLESRHHVKPVHSLSEISLLASYFPENIKQFSAYHDGQIAAGVTIYETETVAHAQYISVAESGRKTGATDLLCEWLINDVYRNKRYFDFGICNEDSGRRLNHGLLDWKEAFGGRASCHSFYQIRCANYDKLTDQPQHP